MDKQKTQNTNLQIVDKYLDFVKYIYPFLVNVSNKHFALKDATIYRILAQIDHFNDAAKSNQVSKLYLADSNLSTIRIYLQLLAEERYKLISKHQYGVSLRMIHEIGSMLNAWISKYKK